MKSSSERVIKKGHYYELQTIEDLMMQQRMPKKQQIQSQPPTAVVTQNIVTNMPSRSDALKNYIVQSSAKVKTDDYGLDGYQDSLEQLLKLPIKDEERLEIQKLLKQISCIKNSEQLPLNSLPQQVKRQKVEQAPKVIDLIGKYNIKSIEQQLKSIEDIKYIELSRLQNIAQILLGQNKDKESQQKSDQTTQIDPKLKQQIEALYNSLSQLTCLNNLPGIMNKIGANQAKYLEVSNWVEKTEEANRLNKQVLDEFENDEILLSQLEENFKKNIESVRQVIKKLSQ